jgi:hypothetical protein
MKWNKKRNEQKLAPERATKGNPGYTITETPGGKFVIVTSTGTPQVIQRVRVGPSKAKPFATHQ